MTRILMSAGEPSGDRYAAAVARELCRLRSGIVLEGVGGRAMARAGVGLVAGIGNLAASGLAEVAHRVPGHLRLYRRLRDAIRRGRYALVLTVDYPGFNLRVAGAAAEAGIPAVHYVAPQLWAWGEWRARRLREHLRALAVILPFEERFFADRGVSATFVGHPLLDQPVAPSRADARTALGLPDDAPVLALFPGSRSHEIARHAELFRQAAEVLRRRRPHCRVVVAREPTAAGHLPDASLRSAPPRLALAAADAALCKAGTTTLQAALAGVPMVIAHRVHPLTYGAARALVRLPAIGLANLLADQPFVPEFVQRRATPERLAAALEPLLDRGSRPAGDQRREFTRLRARLGTPGAAGRVARLALDHVA